MLIMQLHIFSIFFSLLPIILKASTLEAYLSLIAWSVIFKRKKLSSNVTLKTINLFEAIHDKKFGHTATVVCEIWRNCESRNNKQFGRQFCYVSMIVLFLEKCVLNKCKVFFK